MNDTDYLEMKFCSSIHSLPRFKEQLFDSSKQITWIKFYMRIFSLTPEFQGPCVL